MCLFLASLARSAQMPFRFQKPLRTLRKPVFVLKHPCARCANLFLFQNTLARPAQALYFSISPLRTLRKRFIFRFRVCALCASCFLFSFCLCPPRASKLFLEKRREALLINNFIPSGLPHPSVILPNTANAHASDGVSGSLRLSR